MDTVSNPVTPIVLFYAIRPRRSVGNMGFLDVERLVRDTSKYILIQIHGASTAPHGDRKGDLKQKDSEKYILL